MLIILFSCTFAPAAKSYTIHLVEEEQNEARHKYTKATSYFTQNIVYNFKLVKSTERQVFFTFLFLENGLNKI